MNLHRSNLHRFTGPLADLTLVAFVVLFVWSLPRLPDPVVSHIGLSGPDGWMPRPWFIATFAGCFLAFEAFFRWGLGALMARTPARLANVPNRSYWMATKERQAEAHRRMLRLADPSRLFMNAVLLLAYHACVQASGVAVPFTLPIGTFGLLVGGGSVLYTVAVIAWVRTAFRVPPEAAPAS